MKKYCYFIFIIFVLLVLPGCVFNTAKAPVSDEKSLYLLNKDSSIDIFGLSDPAHPDFHKTVKLSDNIISIYKKDKYLYVNDEVSGLSVYNIDNDRFSRVIADFKDYVGIPLENNLVFLASKNKSDTVYKLYDISGPEPKFLSEIELQGSYDRDMIYSDKMVYLMLSNQIFVLAVENNKLILKDKIDARDMTYSNSIRKIDNIIIGIFFGSGTAIYDLNNPESGFRLMSEPTDCPFYINGKNYYTIKENSLFIQNYEDPYKIQTIKKIKLPLNEDSLNLSCNNFVRIDDYIYIASNYYGIITIKITDPMNPEISFSYEKRFNLAATAISGKHIFAADMIDGFKILDVSKDNIDIIKEVSLNIGVKYIYLDYKNNLLFCGAKNNYTHIYNVGNRYAPLYLSTVYHSGVMKKKGDNLFINDGEFIYQYDLSDLIHPVIKKYYETKYSYFWLTDDLLAVNNIKELIFYDINNLHADRINISLPFYIDEKTLVYNDYLLIPYEEKMNLVNVKTKEIKEYTVKEFFGSFDIKYIIDTYTTEERLYYYTCGNDNKYYICSVSVSDKGIELISKSPLINDAKKLYQKLESVYLQKNSVNEFIIAAINWYNGLNVFKNNNGTYSLNNGLMKYYADIAGGE